MKIKFLIPLLYALLASSIAVPIAVSLTGCASTEKTAYRVVGVTDVTVHNAMLLWGAHVKAGKATARQIVDVNNKYEHYQQMMGAAHAAAVSIATAPDGQNKYETAWLAVEAATTQLTTFITAITR